MYMYKYVYVEKVQTYAHMYTDKHIHTHIRQVEFYVDIQYVEVLGLKEDWALVLLPLLANFSPNSSLQRTLDNTGIWFEN